MSDSSVQTTVPCSKCGKPLDGANNSYCKRCFRDYQREWRSKKSGKPFVEREAPPPGTARCSKCSRLLPDDADHFHRNASRKCNRSCWCRWCFAAHKRSVYVPSPRLDTLAVFWNSVEQTGNCWLWHGPTMRRWYGTIYDRELKRILGAHVYSWRLHRGAVPAGMCVCHTCDVPTCVRPDHLFLGTHADNMADKVAKNRQAKGGRIGTAKLTDDQARGVIRAVAGGAPIQHLARVLGGSPRRLFPTSPAASRGHTLAAT